MTRRLGIFGGTFDPVHVGHLRGAREVLDELALDSILFIPAATPPHKPGRRVSDFEHRWQMLRLALTGHPDFALSDVERRMPGKSYTVNTLRVLREELGAPVELFFLTGLDGFLDVHTWWHFMDLFTLTGFAILRRPGYNEDAVESYLREKISRSYESRGAGVYVHPTFQPVHCIANTELAVSSTRIRELAGRRRSVEYLVLPEVMDYIAANRLYQGEGYASEHDDRRIRHGKAHGEHESRG